MQSMYSASLMSDLSICQSCDCARTDASVQPQNHAISSADLCTADLQAIDAPSLFFPNLNKQPKSAQNKAVQYIATQQKRVFSLSNYTFSPLKVASLLYLCPSKVAVTSRPVSRNILTLRLSHHLNKFKSNRVRFWGMLGAILPASLALSMALWLPTGHAVKAGSQNTLLGSQWAQAWASISGQPSVVKEAPTSALQQVLAQKTLTIVTTQHHSTYFGNDGFAHGFGHDVMQGYAKHLGVTLKTLVVADETSALMAVQQGQAQMALTALPKQTYKPLIDSKALSHVTLNCNLDFLTEQGLSRDVALMLPANDATLVNNAEHFLCDKNTINTHTKLASFYNTRLLDNAYSAQRFAKTMTNTLPIYQTSFKQSAKKHDLDWELLVAMGYQESQLQPDATSPTGVQGIMMLTNDTAEAMGETDRVNPVQSIQGGAKYLNQLNRQFSQVSDSDRVWFALASYNMGPQAVKNVQQKVRQQGRNGNSWAEVFRYLAENTDKNSRYQQCIDYVTHIRGYLEALKMGEFRHTAPKVA